MPAILPFGRAAAALICLGLVSLGAARAQDLDEPSDAASDLKHGALLFHGNYCGPGNRGADSPPVDALDRACMHHDRCSPDFGSGRLPACSCNRRLQAEATQVASDPDEPDDLRELAESVAAGATLLPCR